MDVMSQAGTQGIVQSLPVRNILDLQPQSLHQRTLLFVGLRGLLEKAEEFIRS